MGLLYQAFPSLIPFLPLPLPFPVFVVPVNTCIHTLSTDGHWKFLGGAGGARG